MYVHHEITRSHPIYLGLNAMPRSPLQVVRPGLAGIRLMLWFETPSWYRSCHGVRISHYYMYQRQWQCVNGKLYVYKTPCQHNAIALDCIRVMKQLNQSINISVYLYASDYPCSNEVYIHIPSCGRTRDNRGASTPLVCGVSSHVCVHE